MNEDARFEDARDAPLRLKALDAEDLTVVSSLVQDSVFPIGEMAWKKSQRRFAVLLNRFRWEDVPEAGLQGRACERVQSLLSIEDVQRVTTQGINRHDGETVLSLLALSFESGEDGTGRLILTLAGDGAIAVDVEALEVILQDVSRPYLAVSGHMPEHH